MFIIKKVIFMVKNSPFKSLILVLIIAIFITALFSPKKYIGTSDNGKIKIEILKSIEPGGDRYNLLLSKKEEVILNNTSLKFYFNDNDEGQDFSDIRDEIAKTKEKFYCIAELDNSTESRVDFKSKPDIFYLFHIMFPEKHPNV